MFHTCLFSALFIKNVFSQTRGEEVSLIRNSLASQIVEQLIPDVADEVLLEFAAALYQQFTELSEDQFASHVLQTLLLSMTCRIQVGWIFCSYFSLYQLDICIYDIYLFSQIFIIVSAICFSYFCHCTPVTLPCIITAAQQ